MATTLPEHPAHRTVDALATVVALRSPADGRARGIEFRALEPGDRETLRTFYRSLSEESRYRRFFQGVHEVPEAVLGHLAAVDGCDHVALLAVVDGEVVGEAHYVRLGAEPTAAEVSVAVSDSFQGRGIGRRLLGAIGVVARGAGIDTFTYTILPTNRAALALFRSFGGRHGWDDGMVGGRAPLETWPVAGVDPEAVPAPVCDVDPGVTIAA